MSEWTSTFDAVFFLSIGTLFVGLVGALLKYCLRSKCEEFNCCSIKEGCSLFSVKRRVDLEVQEEMHEMDMRENTKNTESKNEQ